VLGTTRRSGAWNFEVISMLTLAVTMIAIILPAAGLAWEKEAGTIEQLLVMPFQAPWSPALSPLGLLPV